MKKIFAILLAILMLSLAACSQNPSEDKPAGTQTPTDNGMPDPFSGYVIQSKTEDRDGSVTVTNYTYDDQGFLSGITVKVGEETTAQYTVTCDVLGRTTKMTGTENGAAAETVYTYGPFGISKVEVSLGGQIIQTTEYSYDEQGNLLLEKTTGSAIGVTEQMEYKYENGRLVTELTRLGDEIQEQHDYFYDENGELYYYVKTVLGEDREQKISTSDNETVLTEYDPSGTLTSTVTTRVDENGNVVYYSSVTPSGSYSCTTVWQYIEAK